MTATKLATPVRGVSIETITPTIAEKYLKKNTYNRNIRERTANAYAADMVNGVWRWNGESIKFAKDGTLLDGQHRLRAIVMADKPVQMLVVRNLPKEAQDTIDAGVTRKFHDVLKLHGEANYAALAATVRGINNWEKGNRYFKGMDVATNAQLMDTLNKYPWVREGMTTVMHCVTAAALPSKAGGTMWWLFMNINQEDAEDFFKQLITGENLSKRSPILALRRQLLASTESKRGARNATYLAAITVKAWNKYRAGEEVSLLSWRAGGAKPEKFPEPQ